MNRRVGRAGIALAGVLAIAGVTGCALVPGGGTSAPITSQAPAPGTGSPSEPSTTPTQAPTTAATTPAATASATPTGTVEPPSQAPTPTATATAKPVSAKGSMRLYENLVSEKLTGTCGSTGSAPALKVADKKNDFFETVDVTVALTADRASVQSVNAALGEDSEGVTRKLAYTAPGQSGETATLTVSGSTYKVSGKALMFENGARTGSLIPYSITVTCSSQAW